MIVGGKTSEQVFTLIKYHAPFDQAFSHGKKQIYQTRFGKKKLTAYRPSSQKIYGPSLTTVDVQSVRIVEAN